MRFYYILIILLLACSRKNDPSVFQDEKHKVFLNQIKADHFQLVSVNNQGDSCIWELPYPVYRIRYADITNNGENEIIVGVIKTTRFDSTTQKRLFVFKHVNDLLRPKWLGSRLGMPIEDFWIERVNGVNQLIVAEVEPDTGYAIARYEWDRFGFKFLRYDKRNCILSDLKLYLHE